jgi:hypothetical protein
MVEICDEQSFLHVQDIPFIEEWNADAAILYNKLLSSVKVIWN